MKGLIIKQGTNEYAPDGNSNVSINGKWSRSMGYDPGCLNMTDAF